MSAQLSSRSSPPAVNPLADASLVCGNCGVANRTDRKYCASCGARLWEPCLKCGHGNAPAERHCGQCGTNLARELEQTQRVIEAALNAASELAANGDHLEAIERLLATKIADHSALTRHREERDQRVAALRGEMQRCDRERDLAIVRGRYLLEQTDYEQAAVVLEAVPQSYRTAELAELLDQVRSRQIDVLTLVAEIRRAVAEKKTEGLLPKVEELLALKPDHPQARSLAERLRPLEQKKKLAQRDALYKAAKTLLEQHDYAGATEKLKQIPADASTPQLLKFIEETSSKAAEVEWLTRDLTQAVVQDEWHGSLAERLLKLQPNSAVATAAIQRFKAGKRVCSAPPPTSQWGGRLETIAEFRRVDLAKVSAPLKANPQRFCVAAGLALQGLQRAWVNINLVPPDKGGLLGGLLKGKRRAASSAWGVDVGHFALRALRLSLAEDGRVVADAAIEVEHSQILTAPDANPELILQASFDKLCQESKLGDATLCVGIAGHKALFRAIVLPRVDDKKLAELMKFEVREQIPLPTEHVVWGYQSFGAGRADVAYVRECDVALVALKLDEAQAALAPFAQRGLKVDILTSDATALTNFIMFESDFRPAAATAQGADTAPAPAASEPDLTAVTAVLDVGADSSNLVVTNGRALAVRSIPLGGNAFSRLMVKEFQLTFSQAEKVKRNPTAVRELHRLYAVLEPRFADLSRELHRTIDAFLQVDPARRLDRLIFTGGALKLHGAVRRMWYGE